MDLYDAAHALADSIRQSEMVRECETLRQTAEADETNRALLAEYRRLQLALQVSALGGGAGNEDEMRRFSQIASLLYMNPDAQAYLLAEMRVQKLLADLVKILSDAVGLRLELPGEG